MSDMKPKYNRVLLKLSGEAIQAEDGIINFDFLGKIADVIKKCHDCGVQMGVLIGGGNIWRGRQSEDMDRCRADHMGMLATVINAIAVQDTLIGKGLNAKVMTAVSIEGFCDKVDEEKANYALDNGEIVVFGGGLGIPFFSTDTAAVVRGAQINADAVLMAKNIDGVYSADPRMDSSAIRYDSISYQEIINKQLKALDLTATIFCMDNNIKCYAFELKNPENIYKVIMGDSIGTEMHI